MVGAMHDWFGISFTSDEPRLRPRVRSPRSSSRCRTHPSYCRLPNTAPALRQWRCWCARRIPTPRTAVLLDRAASGPIMKQTPRIVRHGTPSASGLAPDDVATAERAWTLLPSTPSDSTASLGTLSFTAPGPPWSPVWRCSTREQNRTEREFMPVDESWSLQSVLWSVRFGGSTSVRMGPR